MISEMKYFNDKYVYFDEKEMKWKIKAGVPNDIREELEDFLKAPEDEDGIITLK